MKKIRVLVGEDSLTIRERLVEILTADPEIEVVGKAADGKAAIELCTALRPDVVTLDMMMPMMSGLAATEFIMAHCPTPILIVSASTNRGELFKTYEALSAGAIDVLDKPLGNEPNDAWEARFVATVKLISRIKVITHLRARLGSLKRTPHLDPSPPALSTTARDAGVSVVGLGASTGGPGALLEVLRALPAPFPVPILVVLHIGEQFAAAFADWLGSQSLHTVTEARDGERLDAMVGQVRVAPPGKHLVVRDRRTRLSSGPERHSCRPSVDVLFESLATELGARALGCLLTGMGRDGATGLLAMRAAGAPTFAQDEASSIVYGMPREAALLGAARTILPLSGLGPAIRQLVLGGAA